MTVTVDEAKESTILLALCWIMACVDLALMLGEGYLFW